MSKYIVAGITIHDNGVKVIRDTVPQQYLEDLDIVTMTEEEAETYDPPNDCQIFISVSPSLSRNILGDVVKGKSVTQMCQLPSVNVDGYRAAACLHPVYVLKNSDPEAVQEWKDRIIDIFNGEDTVEYNLDNKILDINSSKVKDLIKSLTAYKGKIGFDYETNTLEPFREGSKILGFSLVVHIGDIYKGWYLNCREGIKDYAREMMSEFFRKKGKDLIAYNCAFEFGVTWKHFGERVEFLDSMAYCIADGNWGSLKNNSRKYLKSDVWEFEVSAIKNFSNDTKSLMDKTDTDHLAILEYLKDPESSLSSKIIDQINYLKTILEDPDEIEFIVKNLENGAWESIPDRILSLYCSRDSMNTLILYEQLSKIHSEDSVSVFRDQILLSGVMSLYGFGWDEKTADRIETLLIKNSNDALGRIIGAMYENELTDSDEDMDKKFLYDLYTGDLPFSIERGKRTVKTIVIDEERKRQNCLKELYNPGSTTGPQVARFWDMVYTEENRNANIAYHIKNFLDGHQIRDKFGDMVDYKNISESVEALTTLTPSQVVKKLDDIPDEPQVDKLKRAKKVVNDIIDSVVQGFDTADSLTYKTSEGCVCNFFEFMIREIGIDPEDESTWTPEWRLMIDYRVFKKAMKSVSTYINGRLGRNSVWLCERSEQITIPPNRLFKYEDIPSDFEVDDDKHIYILDSGFLACAAETGRWRAGLHCCSGDTQIQTSKGSFTIQELIDSNDWNNYFVVCSNGQGENELAPITDITLDHYSKEFIEIECQDGTVHSFTLGHRLLKADGTYIKVEDVTPETELASWNDNDLVGTGQNRGYWSDIEEIDSFISTLVDHEFFETNDSYEELIGFCLSKDIDIPEGHDDLLSKMIHKISLRK